MCPCPLKNVWFLVATPHIATRPLHCEPAFIVNSDTLFSFQFFIVIHMWFSQCWPNHLHLLLTTSLQHRILHFRLRRSQTAWHPTTESHITERETRIQTHTITILEFTNETTKWWKKVKWLMDNLNWNINLN